MVRWRVWVLCFVLVVAAGGRARAERVLIDSDFAGASPATMRWTTVPATADAAGGSRLPAGWTDNAMGESPARYERAMADKAPVLRVTRDKAAIELRHPLPADAGTGDGVYYRLTVVARSVTRASVEVGVRGADGKSKPVWSARPDVNEILAPATFTFQVPKQSRPLAVTLSVPPAASVELARVRLVEFSRDELVAQMKKDAPKGGAMQNLLRVSRFPVGVQAGGAVGRERSDEQYTADGDPETPGPSGFPSLKLACEQPLRFLLPPAVVPWTFTRHTASVYLRGRGSGSLVVLADGQQVAAKPFSVSGDEWDRVELAFDPTLLARQHQVVLDVTGTVWADAFQLEPGETATEYVRRPEVSLVIPETDASVARIQFDDDPAVVDFVVTGGENNVLNARVHDVTGRSRTLPDIALVGASIARGSLSYAIFEGRSLGAFRVEAWVEDNRGRRISPFNEFVITRVRRPRHWGGDAPGSPFGLHLGPVRRQMVMAKAVGINWVRLHDAGIESVAWSFVEPEKGRWVWRDEEIERYRKHDLSILATLSQSPGWASGLGGPVAGYWDRYYQPANVEDFANYVRTVTARYQGHVTHWDVWNEPWMKFWSKYDPAKKEAGRSPTAAADFARLQQAAYAAAKGVNPDFTVLGLNSTGGGHGSGWTKQLIDAGGLGESCDAYSYHSYTNEFSGFPGDAASRHFLDAFGPLLAGRRPATAATTGPATVPAGPAVPAADLDKPVWMTEGSGTNLLITRGLYHHAAPGEDAEDPLDTADRLARYEVSTLSQGVAKLFLYHTNVPGHFSPGPGAFQTLVTDDGYVHPSAAAHAALAWHVEGKRFVKRVEVARGVFASIFVGGGHSVAVLTSARDHAPYTPPAAVAMDTRDLFGNDVKDDTPFDGRTTYVDLQGTPADLEKALAGKK